MQVINDIKIFDYIIITNVLIIIFITHIVKFRSTVAEKHQ